MPGNRRAAQPFQNAHLDFLRTQSNEPVEARSKTFDGFAGQPDNQVGVKVNAGLAPQEVKVVFQPRVMLPALDELADGFVERLDANFELQRARRKFLISSRSISGSRSGTISK